MDRDERRKPWKHVQVETSNPNAHYLADILIQVAKTCGLALTPSSSAEDRLSIVIGSEIEAGGSVELSDVDVTIVGDSFETAVRDRERVHQVAAGLAEALGEIRVALIFLGMEGAPSPIVRAIRSQLWD